MARREPQVIASGELARRQSAPGLSFSELRVVRGLDTVMAELGRIGRRKT